MTVTSATEKSLLDSLRLKLIVAVCVLLSVVLLLLTMIVGGVVSVEPEPEPMVKETALLASPPSLFRLPAASLKRSELTTMAALVEPEKGVKVAV